MKLIQINVKSLECMLIYNLHAYFDIDLASPSEA